MSFTFIHTADWQIGKPFGEFAGDKPGNLRGARLEAVDRIADIARQRGAAHVLAAGDIFDFETGSPALVRKLIQLLAGHRDITWHLISGNHDPARASSVWDEVRASSPPPNVRLHLESQLAMIAPGVALLPAPLKAKSCVTDPTAWMDHAASDEGTIRIGLAHGSVTGFGSEGDAAVPIAPARPRAAGLAYLALGDWHGTKKIADRVWYSGTPEPDCFPGNDPGNVLAVTLESATAVPRVEQIRSAKYTWLKRDLRVADASDIEAFAAELTALGPAAQRHLVQLTLSGSVHLAAHAALAARLEALDAALFHLEWDLSRLTVLHDVTDLAVFGQGAVRSVAERLAVQADSGSARQSHIAAQALLKLARLTAAAGGDAA